MRWLKRLAILLVIVSALVALRLTLLAPEPLVVRVHTVGRGRVEETVTNSRAGTVRARQRAELSPELGGKVIALPFGEGERVRKGAVLLKLDDEIQRAELQLVERELAASHARRESACATAEQAERDQARIGRLAEDEIASTDLLDKARAQAEASAAVCRAAIADTERARAAVGLAEAQLKKMVLRAPFDGVVAELSTELGEWVTPSPPGLPIPPVIDVLDHGSIYISAPMDEVDSARIAPNQKVRVSIDSYPGLDVEGHLTRVAPYVLDREEQNRTVEIEVELDDAAFAKKLLPGTSADVEVILEVREDALRVPTPALMEGGRVLVVEGDRLLARDVQVGLENWDFTEILAGLEPGEHVVMSLDHPGVAAGARVVIEEGS